MPETRPYKRYDRDEIVRQLESRMLDLATTLFPPEGGGYQVRDQYFPLNHVRGDKNPGSFVIHVGGDKCGGWYEYAGDFGGNTLGLIAYAKGLDAKRDFGKVLAWAAHYLGTDPVQHEIATSHTRQGGPKRDMRKFAHSLWLNSQKSLKNTLAEVYFRTCRGIDLDALPRPPGAVRFDPKCRYYNGPNKKMDFTTHPALMSLMINGRLQVCGLHRTYLLDDGSDKLSVKDNKKMLGAQVGGFIPLARGASDLPVRAAVESGLIETLAITEGIEDGLSVALARPDWRVWAAGTLGNIGNVPWPETFQDVHICAQNDTHKSAIAALDKSRVSLDKKSKGRALYLHKPPAYIKDWNDWLRASVGEF